MANKFYLTDKGYGKYKHPVPTLITSQKQLKELMDEGVKIFNSRKEAFKEAIHLRKEN
jgi:hypothetical protein